MHKKKIEVLVITTLLIACPGITSDPRWPNDTQTRTDYRLEKEEFKEATKKDEERVPTLISVEETNRLQRAQEKMIEKNRQLIKDIDNKAKE